MLELQVAVVVGTALFFIVGLAPSTNRGRRPMYNTVGIDRHRTGGTHRAWIGETPEMAAARGAGWARPAAVDADPKTTAEARADALVAGLVRGKNH
jgi:hypothetical protein